MPLYALMLHLTTITEALASVQHALVSLSYNADAFLDTYPRKAYGDIMLEFRCPGNHLLQDVATASEGLHVPHASYCL